MTLSFVEIAEKTQLPVNSIEVNLTKMVQNGAITARINKKQGTVDFLESEGDENDDSASGTLVNNSNFEMVKTIEV